MKAEQNNIRFALRWSDGHKLDGVKHVKGDAWKAIIDEKDDFNWALTGLPPTTNEQGETFRDYEPEQEYGTAHDFQEHTRFGGSREDY